MDTISPTSAASPDGTALQFPGGATVFADLSSTVAMLEIAGSDATTFLQGQLSNDVRRVTPARWQHTTYNSPKGRMLATLLLWGDANGYRAVLPAELAESVRKRLTMYVLRAKVTIADRASACFGIAGPISREIVSGAWGEAPVGGAVLQSGAVCVLGLGEERYLAIAPADDAAALRARLSQHAEPVGPEVWSWLAIRAGVPVVTRATQDLFVAQTANFDALGGLAFDKGCYTGQEIIARTQYLGRLKERLLRWHVEAEAVAPGTRLYSSVFGDQACGTVVNAARAPTGGIDLLAVLQVAAADSDDVHLGSLEGPKLQPLPLPYDLPQAAPRPARPKL